MWPEISPKHELRRTLNFSWPSINCFDKSFVQLIFRMEEKKIDTESQTIETKDQSKLWTKTWKVTTKQIPIFCADRNSVC